MSSISPSENGRAILPIRKPEHADFLRELFNGKRGEPLQITRSDFTGRFIFSLRHYSKRPVTQKVPQGMIPVEVVFPQTQLSTSERRFCYFPLECVEQINDFLGAAFDLYFHIYFFDTGDLENLDPRDELREVPLTRELLVDSFVSGLDMEDISRASETFKKRQYRKQVREMARLREKFLKKDYNYRRKIYQKRRNNLKYNLFDKLK